MIETTTAAAAAAPAAQQPPRYYLRFDLFDRVLHAILMISFVGCALSGIPLIAADQAWARTLARLLGGFQSAGLIHRICATVLIVLLVAHLARIFVRGLSTRNGSIWCGVQTRWSPT